MLARTLRTVSSPNWADTHTHTHCDQTRTGQAQKQPAAAKALQDFSFAANPDRAGAVLCLVHSSARLLEHSPRPNPNWAGAKANSSSESAAEFFLFRDQTRTGQARKQLTAAKALQNSFFPATKPK